MQASGEFSAFIRDAVERHPNLNAQEGEGVLHVSTHPGNEASLRDFISLVEEVRDWRLRTYDGLLARAHSTKGGRALREGDFSQARECFRLSREEAQSAGNRSLALRAHGGQLLSSFLGSISDRIR